MPLPIYRLRRWLLVIVVLFIAMITGVYYYARLRERDILKEIPNKLGIDIKQTANGFQFSKSDGKRTLFTVQASDLKQFKLDGSAELHNVSIILYGRDSSRFDQIYGSDFSYDKKSGDITGKGEVQIDLEANPEGQTGPDQGAPKQMKNPIHLKTTDLVFNQNSGDAATAARVDFRTPQAAGWAIGIQYSAKTQVLTLGSEVHVTLGGEGSSRLFATHGVITRDPRVIVLDQARLERPSGIVEADAATFFLTPDNAVERVLAQGNVRSTTAGENAEPIYIHADQGEMFLTGKQNLLRSATLTGNVHVERAGAQPMQGDAGRAVLDFIGQNELQKVHAFEGVHLIERGGNASNSSGRPAATPANASPPQDFDITAPAIDFFVANGKRLDRAQTSGPPQITIVPAQNSKASAGANGQRTVITAGRFEAKFVQTPKGSSRLASVHGAPDAKIVNSAAGVPDRVSTSQTLDATFFPQGIGESGIEKIIQQGSVAYSDGLPTDKRTQAWADKAVYTPTDRILALTGSPRVADGGMVTTAHTIRINRETDEAFAEGNVKSTYSELKEQPDGALLASASPIHVTSATMTAHNSPAVALYQGNARLWQDANILQAPSIQFDRDRRSLVAQGTSAQPVSTIIVQAKAGEPGQDLPVKSSPNKGIPDKSRPKQSQPMKSGSDQRKVAGTSNGKGLRKPEDKFDDTSPITVTSARLTYSDVERLAHYEGGVTAQGSNFTETSKTLDAYLRPISQTSYNQSLTSAGQLDHMVAQSDVVVVQPNRRAVGDRLVYTAADSKFVLTGGPPSIFDAEQGKITGVSLTFFRGDDRVLVEGEANTPVVTQTRVAR
jgi:lipopolysaccharide export system protein LptA